MQLKLKTKRRQSETRTLEQLQEHYELEKELASKLMNSGKQSRKHLYTELYDELFTKLSHHPQVVRISDPATTAWIVEQRMILLNRYLSSKTTFLEVGPGDCSLAIEVSKLVKKVYAVDVATEITKQQTFPGNFEFINSDGCSVPVPENSVDIAYSHQLMEHLHPEDANEQLQNIYRALAPNGIYICITPNRLSGPHDISRYFDKVATGFHLKEYTVTELYKLFRSAGFSKVTWVKNNKKAHIEIPLNLLTLPTIAIAEKLLEILPLSFKRRMASLPILFRSMTIVGEK